MKKKYLIKAACLFSVAMLMGCAQEDNSKTEKKGCSVLNKLTLSQSKKE